MKSKLSKIFLIAVPIWAIGGYCYAHDVIKDLEKMSKSDAAFTYLKSGFEHILPLGFDHILFIVSLFLLSPKLKTIFWQATAFTIAHSVTLGLAMYGIITPSSNIVEPLISLSIMYVALENIFSPRLKPSRIGIVFFFGLVHGMGFAGALRQMGLPQNSYFLSLIMFNIGVEIGQICIILASYLIVKKWWNNQLFYRKNIVVPLSIFITLISAYWTFERIF
jgi:HupE / UreJ protein